MKKSFKTGTIKSTPSKIGMLQGDGEGLEVSRFAGIASAHTVFLIYGPDYNTMGYIYICSPESGEINSLKKWAKMENTYLTWTPRKDKKKYPLGQMEAWKAATDHAMSAAFNEVARESDLDLPASFWNEYQDLVDKRDDDEYQQRTQAGGDGPRKKESNVPSLKILTTELLFGDLLALPNGIVSRVKSEPKIGRLYVSFDTGAGPLRLKKDGQVLVTPRKSEPCETCGSITDFHTSEFCYK